MSIEKIEAKIDQIHGAISRRKAAGVADPREGLAPRLRRLERDLATAIARENRRAQSGRFA